MIPDRHEVVVVVGGQAGLAIGYLVAEHDPESAARLAQRRVVPMAPRESSR